MNSYPEIHASACGCPACVPWHPADSARVASRARLATAALIAVVTAILVAALVLA